MIGDRFGPAPYPAAFGNETFCPVPARLPPAKSTEIVRVSDISYWFAGKREMPGDSVEPGSSGFAAAYVGERHAADPGGLTAPATPAP